MICARCKERYAIDGELYCAHCKPIVEAELGPDEPSRKFAQGIISTIEPGLKRKIFHLLFQESKSTRQLSEELNAKEELVKQGVSELVDEGLIRADTELSFGRLRLYIAAEDAKFPENSIEKKDDEMEENEAELDEKAIVDDYSINGMGMKEIVGKYHIGDKRLRQILGGHNVAIRPRGRSNKKVSPPPREQAAPELSASKAIVEYFTRTVLQQLSISALTELKRLSSEEF